MHLLWVLATEMATTSLHWNATSRTHLSLWRPITVSLKILVRLLHLFASCTGSRHTRLLLIRHHLLLLNLIRLVRIIGLMCVATLTCCLRITFRHPHLRLLRRLNIKQHFVVKLVILSKVNVVCCFDVLSKGLSIIVLWCTCQLSVYVRLVSPSFHGWR